MVNNRTDLELITSLVDKEARILDVGCGNGELLKSLKNKKNVKGQGLELKQERVNKCVAKGLSAIQGNADSDLSLYPDQSFDCVILSQTIQATNNPKNILIELIRIGKKAIISIPNFGYWKVRLGFAIHGKMPITEKLSNNWYDTPNIHLCSILDFVDLCRELNLKLRKQLFLNFQITSDPLTVPQIAGQIFLEKRQFF
ncbi:MAG: methionine biosynthesis protein MetW [Candidatus Dadabacteria bacterium]|nr:MAG: methionine biosynthesis protein MetW [Candidatus Dadabacteria bacterium]